MHCFLFNLFKLSNHFVMLLFYVITVIIMIFFMAMIVIIVYSCTLKIYCWFAFFLFPIGFIFTPWRGVGVDSILLLWHFAEMRFSSLADCNSAVVYCTKLVDSTDCSWHRPLTSVMVWHDGFLHNTTVYLLLCLLQLHQLLKKKKKIDRNELVNVYV